MVSLESFAARGFFCIKFGYVVLQRFLLKFHVRTFYLLRYCEEIWFSNFAYTFVLRAEIATAFGPKMVAFSARNIKAYKLCKAIFSAFYNISQPNFPILLILVCSF
jgi:hypothetical protein